MTQPTEWTPRVWQGCTFPAFLRLMWTNRLAVAPRFFYMPLVMTTASALTTVAHLAQESWYGSRLDRTPIREPPLFILGHWRTGTTLLHELLALDPRFTYPTTYHCFAPHHFLLTEPLADRFLRWMLPSRRPMDNMPVGWSRPQEDEFALCLLGQPSPYSHIAFPNRPPPPLRELDLDLPPRRREAWKRAFLGFLKRVTFRDPRRLLLKSPTHTCRLPTLLELFPDAQFLHVVRNPYVVFSSTVKLWRSLYLAHGMQVPTFAGLEEYVFAAFSHLYNRLQATRGLVPEGNFLEVRYEDLVASPAEVMRGVYDGLRLGGFDEARPRVEAFWREQAGYQTNRFPPLDPAVRAEIARRWGDVIERYGYAPPLQ
jgi:hypothetical protein